MAHIAIVDDDFGIEPLIDCLAASGHTVRRYENAAEAVENLGEIALADAVVLDVMMARPDALPESATRGGHLTGLVIAQKLRLANPKLPILIFSGTSDGSVRDWAESQNGVRFVSRFFVRRISDLIPIIDGLLGGADSKGKPRIFIIHGHDEATKLAVKNFLQNTLKLPEPVILHEQPSQGATIIEKLERYGAQCDAAVAILTPDDIGAAATDDNSMKRRARQNVIFELGFFLGLLGRRSGRVMLLHKGKLELPSDINGLVYIDISNGIEAAGELIRREVDHVLGNR